MYCYILYCVKNGKVSLQADKQGINRVQSSIASVTLNPDVWVCVLLEIPCA